MTSPSPSGICLVSMSGDPNDEIWREIFSECIESAKLAAIPYSEEAVGDASCLLAFPQSENSLIYQLAFSRGRGLPALLILHGDEPQISYTPPPTATIRIKDNGPRGVGDDEKRAVTDKLRELALSGGAHPSTHQDEHGEKRLQPSVSSQYPLVTTMDQAEELLQELLAEVESQENIRKLLIDAGAKPGWLKIRLFHYFGGW